MQSCRLSRRFLSLCSPLSALWSPSGGFRASFVAASPSTGLRSSLKPHSPWMKPPFLQSLPTLRSSAISSIRACVGLFFFLPILQVVAEPATEATLSSLAADTDSIEFRVEEMAQYLKGLNEYYISGSGYLADTAFHVFAERYLDPYFGYSVANRSLWRHYGLGAIYDAGLDGNWLGVDIAPYEQGNALDYNNKLLYAIGINQIMQTYLANGGAGSTIAKTYLESLGLSNRNFRVTYTNLWNQLPLVYRRNNIASYGFGNPRVLQNGYTNFTDTTRVPDQFSDNRDDALLYWLMRMAAEQHAFNKWASNGGLLSNIPFDALEGSGRFLTNEVYKRGRAFLIPMFENYSLNDPSLPSVFSLPGDGTEQSGLAVSLADYLRLNSVRHNLSLTDTEEHLSDFYSFPYYTDPLFQTFIAGDTSYSYMNLQDDAYNPDGILTNLPLLYREDVFMPRALEEGGVPPSIEQYAAWQRAMMMNRLTVMAFALTNTVDILGVDTNDMTNAVFDASSYANEARDKYFHLDPNYNTIGVASNNLYQLQETLETNLQSEDYILVPTINQDSLKFDFPSSDSFRPYVINVYKMLFFALYLALVISEFRYWTLNVILSSDDKVITRIEDP